MLTQLLLRLRFPAMEGPQAIEVGFHRLQMCKYITT